MKYGFLKLQHGPHFEGVHNAIKAKCFLVLNNPYHFKATESGYIASFNKRSELDAHEIANEAGINYDSLITLLRRWRRWRYVKATKRGRVNYYSLTKHGKEWLERWWPKMPDYQKEMPLFNEIKEFNRQNFRGYTI